MRKSSIYTTIVLQFLLIAFTAIVVGFARQQEGKTSRHIVRESTSIYTQLRIMDRLKANRHNWRVEDLQKAIDEIVGQNPQTRIVQKKVYHSKPGGIYAIIEDPIGHYFRIAKLVNGHEVYLTRDLQVLNQSHSGEFQSHTHFSYLPFAGESYIETQEDALNAELYHLSFGGFKNLLPIIAEKNKVKRVEKLHVLDWKTLSEPEKKYLVELAEEPINGYEASALLAIARRSHDPIWAPTLARLKRDWNGESAEQWQRYMIADLKMMLKDLGPKLTCGSLF